MPWKLKIGMNLLAALFLASGGMCVVGGARLFRESRTLQAGGVVAPAQVVGSRVKPGDRNDQFYLTVAYRPADGPGLSREIEVSRWKFDAAEKSRTVDVRYLASDPSIVEADGDSNRGFMPLFMGTLLLGLGGWFLYTLYIDKPPGEDDPGYTIE